jgi:ATP-dependent Clp protease adaptor protein ClpS
MSANATFLDAEVRTRPSEAHETRSAKVPPYHVVLENDDYHSFEFVVHVLIKALGYAKERAFQLMLQAHNSGRAVVWTGPKEVAELKADQIRTFREIRQPDNVSLGPLDCAIEPAPGA